MESVDIATRRCPRYRGETRRYALLTSLSDLTVEAPSLGAALRINAGRPCDVCTEVLLFFARAYGG